MMAVLWREEIGIHRLPNIHSQLAEGNLCDEKGSTTKPHVVEDHNHHVGNVNIGGRMANRYSVRCCILKWMKKLCIHLLNLTILNSCILSSCAGKKISHGVFPLTCGTTAICTETIW
jgi:hypothetical protein